MSNRVLTIQLENDTNENDEHDDVTIVSEVLRLLRYGFTSGITPTWCIAQQEQRPIAIKAPLTSADMDAGGWVEGIVSVDLSELIDNDLEGFLDLLSERLVGDGLLMDISYNVVGCNSDGDELLIQVSGDAQNCFREEHQQPYVCDNCGRVAAREDLPDAKDLPQRLVPGLIYTDKECPECHALCFPKAT